MEERTPALRYMEFYDKTDPKVIFQAFTHNDIFITHNDINCVNQRNPYYIISSRLIGQPQRSSLVSKDEKQGWR